MDAGILFLLFELFVGLGISTIVLMVLNPVLYSVLTELCGGEKDIGARFWCMFTRLMLYTGPLIMVLMFSSGIPAGEDQISDVARTTLLNATIGQFVALVIIGNVIYSFSRRASYQKAREAAASEKTAAAEDSLPAGTVPA